jgi:hypothetical protein
MFHVTKQVIKDMCQPQHLENIIQVEGGGGSGGRGGDNVETIEENEILK